MSAGYLGPEGSYSNIAAKNLCGNSTLKAYESFPKLFSALLSFDCEFAVIPIENTLNGGVVQNIDLLQEATGVYAFKECAIKIDHRLATKTGANLSQIKRVYSHSQALEQCAKYLSKNLPDAKLIPVLSTAAGLDNLKTEEDACIVGAHTVRQGVTLSAEGIADEKQNFTRFLLLKRGEISESLKSGKVFFSVTCKNISGGLINLLKPLQKHGLNMSKLQSRPIKDKLDEYRFFIEIEGDYSSENVKRALCEVEGASNGLRILGCY